MFNVCVTSVLVGSVLDSGVNLAGILGAQGGPRSLGRGERWGGGTPSYGWGGYDPPEKKWENDFYLKWRVPLLRKKKN